MKLEKKIGYGIGQLSDGIKNVSFTVFLFFFYNQVLGLSGFLTGAAAMLALIVDAVTDPMIGQLSDRYQSRLGRRHPFMIIGALSFGFAISMLFSPPQDLSTNNLFFWLIGWAILTRLFLTFFFVPHLALGAEIVSGYHEKTALISYRAFFSYTGQLLILIMGFIFFFPPPEGMQDISSYAPFGIFAGILASIAMLISIFSTYSFIPTLPKPAVDPKAKHPILGFITVFQTLKHYSFRILFLATLLFMVLAGVTQTLLIYVGTYLFHFTAEDMGIISISLIIGIIFAPSLARQISLKVDKKNTLAICVIAGSLIAFSPHLLYLSGIIQLLEINMRVIIVFLTNGISQAFFIAYIIMVDSMLTDTIDEHELNTGRREEGLYFSARSLATKASYGLGSFVAGISLDIIKFPRGMDVIDINTESLISLSVLAGPISMILFMLTVVITNKYSLNQKKHNEILLQIKRNSLNKEQ